MELGVRNGHVGDKLDILNGRHGGTRGCRWISKRASLLLVDHLLYKHIGPMSTAADLQCAGNKSFFSFWWNLQTSGVMDASPLKVGVGGFCPMVNAMLPVIMTCSFSSSSFFPPYFTVH